MNKKRAAEAAMKFVRSGMVLGLGTGSTANCFMQTLADALSSGHLRDIRGIPTSRQSEQHARNLGIPLTTLNEFPHPDLTVDGTDEIDPGMDLIKGMGGALLREKILAQNSKLVIIIADACKKVDVLGTRSPLPVEVVEFGHSAHVDAFRALGAAPTLRLGRGGEPFVTDNGNYIYDLKFDVIRNPRQIEEVLLHRAGVVDCGLFLGIAHIALIADDKRVEERTRK
jgi:ribose 5-phosphate isomerase A